MGCILRLLRVPQESQGQVINRPAVFLVNLAKFRIGQTGFRILAITFCQRFAHTALHCGLDSNLARLSRLKSFHLGSNPPRVCRNETLSQPLSPTLSKWPKAGKDSDKVFGKGSETRGFGTSFS